MSGTTGVDLNGHNLLNINMKTLCSSTVLSHVKFIVTKLLSYKALQKLFNPYTFPVINNSITEGLSNPAKVWTTLTGSI